MTPEPGKHPKLSLAWKIASISAGSALIVLGIVGLFLPILQGWLMIFAGLAVLSPHSRAARTVMRKLKEKLGIHHKRTPEDEMDDQITQTAKQEKRTGT
jgi:hypothetical protein